MKNITFKTIWTIALIGFVLALILNIFVGFFGADIPDAINVLLIPGLGYGGYRFALLKKWL